MAATQEIADRQERQDATPERIAMAGPDTYVGDDGARRFTDGILQRLAARGGLYPDREMNLRLLEAGEKYYEDWYVSNMSPLAGFDPTRVFVAGGDHGSMPHNQRQAIHRGNFRKAKDFVGKKYEEVLHAVVLMGQDDLVAVGRRAGGISGRHAAMAIATERLTAGLYLLAKHYGIIR
jgi:hypothetical protein